MKAKELQAKTIKKLDCMKTSGGVKYFWCPYCAKGLSKKEVKELHCKNCGNYLVVTKDGGLRMPLYQNQ